MIDILITATLRPEILERTLSSFYQNLFADYASDTHILINVDPVGEKISQGEVIDVCRQFCDRVTARTPDKPGFPIAFSWLWNSVTDDADWVFHLEDDWELLHPVDLNAMIDIMRRHNTMAALRLPWKRSDISTLKNWRVFFPYNEEGFFECPEKDRISTGFCGHPSLLNSQFVRRVAPLIWTTHNPEKQFHYWNHILHREVAKWRFAVYSKPQSPPAIKDIGMTWCRDNGFKKNGIKAFFQHWEPIPSHLKGALYE